MDLKKISLWGGSVVCFIVWLASLIVYVALPSADCYMNGDSIPPPITQSGNQTGDLINAPPAFNTTYTFQSNNPLYVVSLPTFCVLSLVFLSVFFIFLFYQLFSHEQLSHELMLEDLADTAIVQSINQSDDHSNSNHTSVFDSINQSFDTVRCCQSFTQKLLISVNSMFFILLLCLSILGIGSIQSINQSIPPPADHPDLPVLQQPDSCQRYRGIGIDLLVLDFFLTTSFFILACYRCVTRCINNQSINPSINLAKLVQAARTKRKNQRNNVRYSAVDRQSNQFDQHSDDDDDDLSLHSSHQPNNQFHEDLELMDMLDAHSKKPHINQAENQSQHQVTINQSVPTLAAPPAHDSSSLSQDQSHNAFPGDEDEEEYDYGDINIEDEDEELTLDEEKV